MAETAPRDPQLEVILAVQAQDAAAMAELMNLEGRRVRAVLFAAGGKRDELDDLAQKVWVRVWQQARRLEDVRKWRAWLYQIARNVAIDAARKRGRSRRVTDSLLDQSLADEPTQPRSEDPADRLARREQQERMLAAISALPELYREPFVLRHLEDWNYQQIGEALDLPIETVETRLVRARRLLRNALAGKV
jgi:RNA polymerase sigma-70 factor (ECF subfamily)